MGAPLPSLAKGSYLLYIVDPAQGADGKSRIHVLSASTLQPVHTITTGYDPQIVVSADGRRLYVTDGSGADERLAAYDTESWQLLQAVPSPERIKSIGFGRDAMALSSEGRRLSIHKPRILDGRYEAPRGTNVPHTDHWWDVFDTAGGQFLPNPVHISDCGIAQTFPNTDFLAVLCFDRSEFLFVDLMTGKTSSSVAIDSGTGLRNSRSVAGAVSGPGNQEIFVLTTDGHVISVDRVEQRITRNVDFHLPEGRRILWSMAALDIQRRRLYVGVGNRALPLEDEFHEVWVFDTESWSQSGKFRLPRGVFSIALSPDGENLYAVSPGQSSLTVIDALTGKGRAGLYDLGIRPSLIVTAPAP